MVSTTVFYPVKKLFLQNKNLDQFSRCMLKTYNLHTLNSIQVSFYVVLGPVGKCSQQYFPKFNNETLRKKCGIFSKLAMKTPEEHQCFSMSPYPLGRSGGYRCTWICFNIYLSRIYFMWYKVRYTEVNMGISKHQKEHKITRCTMFSWTCF